MSEDTVLLAEMMLQAEVFCTQIEERAQDSPKTAEQEELRLKISQCRGALAELQSWHDVNKLMISNPWVRADFRNLVISLLWVVFRGGPLVDFKLFRKLVQIESGFTYLLVNVAGRRR
jgi:hypothetical protein